jgi:hypothetical protein
MNQIFYIFRKDVRRHWLEILVSLLLLLCFAWKTPVIWTTDTTFGSERWPVWLFLLIGVALYFSWWFLIVRLIQGESLVGDRQFWLTRPYQRRWLLAAKALFIIAFVNLPVLVFDFIMLARTGFSPWHHGPGLLQGQLYLTGFLLLPVVTFSVVTETVAQFLLVFFGVVAYVVGLTWATSQMPSASSPGSDLPGTVTLCVVVGACLAVLVLQYFRRDTWVSRWILLGTAGVVVAVLIAAPYGPLVERAYPQASLGSLNPAGLKIEKNDKAAESKDPISGKTLSINVPIDVYGLVQGSLVDVNAARLTIYAPGGLAWNSGWVGPGRVLWPGPQRFIQTFEVSSKFYSSVSAGPVDMQIDLAIDEYREGASKQISVTAGNFKVTDDLICALGRSRFGDTGALKCKSALNDPAYAAHLDPLSTTCKLPDTTWPSLQERRNVGRSEADTAGGAGLFAVQPSDIDFGQAANPRGDKIISIVCPGTNFSLATPAFFSRYRVGTSIQGIHLADYRTFSYLN